ncbi:hypothetical protein RBH29_13740 [Herbivorax sp. ANBcel31]|uniref:hypothetical protein n=1 Tax=Herbivorax sp. ANBcel31 TaxID=3069754 RepID=UPI0027B3A6AA|nr:hypothetical protein [Herbivorax sp. ANBcel31]MDQ2087489.1 hypothetical protein [Herbivorax sp. ANBcel31]
MIKFVQVGLKCIIILLVLIIIIERIPIKKAVHIEDIEELNKENGEEIVICVLPQSTGPSWGIVGDENGLFTGRKIELIIIEGSRPDKKLTEMMLFHSNNHFVIIGETTGEKEYDFSGEKYKVFNAKDWHLLKPIDRGMSLRVFSSKNHLSLFDYIFP